MPVLANTDATSATSASKEADLVLVYNRTPTKLGGVYKYRDPETLKYTDLPPGGSATVPASIADNWCRVSNGLVTTSKEGPQLADAHQLLSAERARAAALDAKVKALEERLAKLDRKASA